jgi:ribose 1,5-bisphosphokinase PhnN
LVTCADAGRLDFLLRAAGRHLGAQSPARLRPAALIEPVTTRRLPAGGGIVMKPSGFEELERLGALTLTWREGRHQHGYGVSILARLSSGENVIAGAPQDLEAAARLAWPNLSVIRLSAGTASLRERLSLGASLSRAAARQGVQGALQQPYREGYDVRVEDCADVGVAVRRLAAAVSARLALLETAAVPVAVERGRRGSRSNAKIAAASIAGAMAGKRDACTPPGASGLKVQARAVSPT